MVLSGPPPDQAARAKHPAFRLHLPQPRFAEQRFQPPPAQEPLGRLVQPAVRRGIFPAAAKQRHQMPEVQPVKRPYQWVFRDKRIQAVQVSAGLHDAPHFPEHAPIIRGIAQPEGDARRSEAVFRVGQLHRAALLKPEVRQALRPALCGPQHGRGKVNARDMQVGPQPGRCQRDIPGAAAHIEHACPGGGVRRKLPGQHPFPAFLQPQADAVVCTVITISNLFKHTVNLPFLHVIHAAPPAQAPPPVRRHTRRCPKGCFLQPP